MRCLVSDYSGQPSAKPVRESALVFSRVLREIFGQIAIIPFCFPTLLGDEAELTAFLREHSAHYREDLTRLRNSVQMEVRIGFQPGEPKGEASGQSGKDYLRTRQLRHEKLKAAAQEFRRIGEAHIQDWRQRETAGGMRGYALVARDIVPAFLDAIGGAALSPDLTARITGPWPATEFLKEK